MVKTPLLPNVPLVRSWLLPTKSQVWEIMDRQQPPPFAVKRNVQQSSLDCTLVGHYCYMSNSLYSTEWRCNCIDTPRYQYTLTQTYSKQSQHPNGKCINQEKQANLANCKHNDNMTSTRQGFSVQEVKHLHDPKIHPSLTQESNFLRLQKWYHTNCYLKFNIPIWHMSSSTDRHLLLVWYKHWYMHWVHRATTIYVLY